MRGCKRGVVVLLIASLIPITPVLAGDILPLSRYADTRWTLISLPVAGAPVEKEGRELTNPLITVVSRRHKIVLVRSVADAFRSRMAAHHMNLRLSYTDATLYYPNPVELPMDIKKEGLEL